MPAERLYLRLPDDPVDPPESTLPAGTMVAHEVRPELACLVEMVATHRETIPIGERWTERILPDGAARLIVDLGDTPTVRGDPSARVRVVGPSASPTVLELEGHLEGLSFTLGPGAVPALFGVSTRALTDRAVSLDELWGPGSEAQVQEALFASRTPWARSDALQSMLVRRTTPNRPEATAERGVALMRSSGGRLSVADVASALGVGERRLQQLFVRDVGLTPRAFRRLARLQACIRSLRSATRPRWSQMAVDMGFYDQAHLANEFRALSGLTPSAFLEHRPSGSSKTRE